MVYEANLKVGAPWRTSKSTKLRGKAVRQKGKPAPISANFSFHPGNHRKKISQSIFTGKC